MLKYLQNCLQFQIIILFCWHLQILYYPGTIFSDAPCCTNDTHSSPAPSNVPSYGSSATLLWTSAASYDTPSGTMNTFFFHLNITLRLNPYLHFFLKKCSAVGMFFPPFFFGVYSLKNENIPPKRSHLTRESVTFVKINQHWYLQPGLTINSFYHILYA